MPKIDRQFIKHTSAGPSNGPPEGPTGYAGPAKAISVLSRIKPIEDSKLGRLKMALYGNPKTGKTRLACSFPKPLLIIGTEDGTASVAGTKGIDFVRLETCGEIIDLIRGPILDGRWASVVLDNGTKLKDMRVSELWKARGVDVPEKKPFLYAGAEWREVWVQCANDMKELLSPLLDLPRLVKVNVVIISQEQDFTKESNAAAISDQIKPTVGSALGESVCRFVHAECDYVCNTFIRKQVKTQEVTIGKETMREMVETGKKEFCLRVAPHDVYWTGFRQRPGAPELPDAIVDPSYEKIAKLIQGNS